MTRHIRTAVLVGLVCGFSGANASAEVYSVPVPDLAGVRFTYGDSITAPINFNQSFAQIDQVIISITGTGHTGSAWLSSSWPDPWNPTLEVIDLDAEFMVFVSDDGDADSVFFNDFGVFAETTTTNEHPETEGDPLLNGIGSIRLETNYILAIGGGGALPIDPSYVDIESAMITIVGTSAASFGDPNGDGFVGLNDLDLVLTHWGQTVTPNDFLSGDLTGDGYVGLDDIDVVLNNWNAGTPPGVGVALPEAGIVCDRDGPSRFGIDYSAVLIASIHLRSRQIVWLESIWPILIDRKAS